MASIEFTVRHPDAVQFTAQVTMTLGEWKKVKNALNTESGIAALLPRCRTAIVKMYAPKNQLDT